MRIPPDRPQEPQRRAGRTYEEDLSLRYLSPGAFTVLPPDRDQPDPPTAPNPYRLTPNSRRRREQAFSIIAEPSSNPGSRSPSPSGRVSPFRGRGFNPIGSRHASPAPSPPPDTQRVVEKKPKTSPRKTQIPQLQRRGSGQLFGETVIHDDGYNLSPKLSKSMTNISTKKVHYKPPPSPRRAKPPAFQQLSPIVGSSPEPDQVKSSKIPRSRSQCNSRTASPSRKPKVYTKPASKNPSRKGSRDPSPNKVPPSPTKTRNNYKNVQAKVNSYNKINKPKVPQKPDVINNDVNKQKMQTKNGTEKTLQLQRKESDKNIKQNINKSNDKNGNDVSNSNNKSNNNNKNNSKESKMNDTLLKSKDVNRTETSKVDQENNNMKNNKKQEEENVHNNNTMKQSESVKKLSDLPTTAVSSTTTTVTKPLKIETNLEDAVKNSSSGEKVAPMVDGRILSATSVSNAMNKMNDSVLNSQTLMKEHNFTKLSPAASAIISLSNEEYKTKTLESRNMLPGSENNKISNSVGLGNNSNNVSKMSLSGSGNGTSLERNLNQSMMGARNVIAADVKPLRINVKEKPPIEVQSGNVRYPSVAANGISEAPMGLPPPQPPQNEPEQSPEKKPSVCTRLIKSCRQKVPCSCCTKSRESEMEKNSFKKDNEEKKPGCFSCCSRKNKNDSEERINFANESIEKKSCWESMKCCGRNKVGDETTGCCPLSKKKQSWRNREDSIFSKIPPTSRCVRCKNFLRRLFCCCCKNKEPDPVSRRESVLSKKKSLSLNAPPPPEKPKLDLSLVEHGSHMKAAIPVLPVKLAWFCLICNVLLPGLGTILSGMFCLCIGIPRFSQKDGPRPRIGAFIIDLIIGCGQLFTVLFCLVGWGWSIWWGVIMLKIAKKYEKIKGQETLEERSVPMGHPNQQRDVEKGAT